MSSVVVKVENQKRARAVNWGSNEKSLLLEIVKEFRAVLEDKKTTTNTNRAKIDVWREVHKRFSEINERNRSISELKQQWRTLKMDAKKEVSTHRHAQSLTGGGSKPPSPSPESLLIVDMLPLEFVKDYNPYDSNAQPVVQDSKVTQAALIDALDFAAPNTSKKSEEKITQVPGEGTTDITEEPQFSKKVKNMKIPRKMKTMNVDKFGILAEERIAVFKKKQEDEQEIKIKNLKDEHKWKMLEHDTKMKYMAEEHSLKIQCLKLKMKKNVENKENIK